jgi:hypothetical protein
LILVHRDLLPIQPIDSLRMDHADQARSEILLKNVNN